MQKASDRFLGTTANWLGMVIDGGVQKTGNFRGFSTATTRIGAFFSAFREILGEPNVET
jgi:hypothetical protein